MTGDIQVEMRDVTFGYGEKPLFEGVSLDLRVGELLFVLGENGSGKSTILKLLCGILKPDSGEISFRGRPLEGYGRRELARCFSYAGDEFPADFPLTVFDYVSISRFPSRGFFSPLTDYDRLVVDEAMDLMEISGLKERYLQEISSGERQRTLLARALSQEGTVIVLDEPSAHLDVKNSLKIFNILRKLSREGKSVIVSSHDANLTGRFSSSVLVLKGGRFIAHGETADVITGEVLREAFEVETVVDKNPYDGSPRVTLVE